MVVGELDLMGMSVLKHGVNSSSSSDEELARAGERERSVSIDERRRGV